MENVNKTKLQGTKPTSLSDMIFEYSNDILVIADLNFNVVSVNKMAEKKLHISQKAINDKNLFHIFPEVQRLDLKAVLEGTIRSAKIESISKGRNYEWLVLPLIDESRNIGGIICIIHDITLQVANESKINALYRDLFEKKLLLDNRAHLAETIINSSTDLIFVLDKNLRFCAANKVLANYCCKKQEELLGKTIFDCFPDVKDSELMEKVYAAFNGSASTIKRVPCLMDEGICNVSIVPLSYEKVIYGVLVVAQDVAVGAGMSEFH